MKRWIVRIALCLVLGAISTAALAWACAYWIDLSEGAETYPRGLALEKPNQSWIGVAQRRFGSTLFVSYRNKPLPPFSVDSVEDTGWEPQQIVPKWTGFHEEPEALSASGCDLAVQMADCRGWPLLALWSGPIVDSRTNGNWTFVPRTVGLDAGLPPTQMLYGHTAARLLPLRPIWSGFPIKSVLYGTLWYGSLFACVDARFVLRLRRGRCIKCGYDLRGQIETGCHECGWNRSTALQPAGLREVSPGQRPG